MPSAIRGSIHWYDYGPIVGNELSDVRPALVISNTELNNGLVVVITLPMSSTIPPVRHLRNHVFVESANSWASARQIKSVDQGRLGDKIGEATPREMERALEILVERLDNTRNKPGTVLTQSGYERIEPGAIWDVEFHSQDDALQLTRMLIIDYNDGNKMAVAVGVESGQNPNSSVRVPINMNDSSESASALIHRIRSFDTEARPMIKVSSVDEDSLMSVNSALLRAIDH